MTGRPPIVGSQLAWVEAEVQQYLGDVLRSWFEDPHTTGYLDLARTVLDALLRDPVATRHADGNVTLAWPDEHTVAAVVHRQLLEELVDDLNRMRAGADLSPAPEGVEYSDGQWWATILDLPAEARARRIAEFRDAVRQGLRCWAEQHRERLDPCEAWSERDATDTSHRCMLPSRYPHPVHWHISGATWSVETGGRP